MALDDLLPKFPQPDIGSLMHQLDLTVPEIPQNPLMVEAQANHASEFYKRIMSWIHDFDASLDQAHEVGVRLVSFGQTVVFHLSEMGYWNPSLISFSGLTEDGNPVELIQHVSQISILLMKLPRKDPSKPKKPIGFSTELTDRERDNSVANSPSESIASPEDRST